MLLSPFNAPILSGNVIQPFREDLYRLIGTVWADIGGVVFRMTQIQRRNWVNEIKAGRLVPPYCVVEIPQKVLERGASVSAPTWKVTPTVYYIAAESSGGGDIGGLIEWQLETLSNALLYPQAGGPSFNYTVIDEPQWDTSASEAVNASMLGADMPFLSGAISFGCWIGFVPNRA